MPPRLPAIYLFVRAAQSLRTTSCAVASSSCSFVPLASLLSHQVLHASPLIPPYFRHVVTLPCEIDETFLNNSGQLFAFSRQPVSAHQRCSSQQRRRLLVFMSELWMVTLMHCRLALSDGLDVYQILCQRICIGSIGYMLHRR